MSGDKSYKPTENPLFLGQARRRVEDRRFLTGKGRYVDDMQVPNCAYAAFVRSPHAHARILKIDASAALALPGVLCVITGEDWIRAGLGAEGPLWPPVASTDGVERKQHTRPTLTRDKVRYVGDAVAAVVAETKLQALDALEAVVVEYETLPAVSDTARALDPGAPLVHDDMQDNAFFLREQGSREEVERAFATAHHVTELKLRNNRITANPMEPRAVLGTYDEAGDQYTLYSTHQAPHMLRRSLANHTLLHPEHKLRVVAPDVGGGFGMKVVDYPEDAVVLYASKLTGRPVRWTATRQESLLTDAHGRDHATTCRMAFDNEGHILGISADTIASLGAYQTHRGASIPAFFYGNVMVGLYKTKNIYCRVRGVHTHASPVHAYRGAGRPEAVFVLERLFENGARELGIDVAEMRARNLLSAADFPYKTPVGLEYDSGNPPGLLEKVRKLSNYAALREEQQRLRKQGVLMGIGMAAWIDSVGAPSKTAAAFGRKTGGWDSAIVRVHPTGKVTVFAGSHSHGQSHATTFAQIAAERLKYPIEDIEIVEGDTDKIPYGHGTWGSRSTVTSGMAILTAADRIVDKSRKIAAFLLECSDKDLLHEIGAFRIDGTDRKITTAQIAEAAYHGARWPEDLELGLESTAFYDPLGRSFASAIHLAVVIVDPGTGRVTLRDYCAVDDCGTIINPMVLEGQVHGGVAQGIGQALMEDLTMDHATGQVLAGTFMDYAMPRASDFPFFRLDEQVTPSPNNALGVKGGGESGTIGAPAALGNAVVDALWHLGVRHVEMPMTASAVWQAIRAAAA
jgi:carbon-monoxide dehydrogenase large subunit